MTAVSSPVFPVQSTASSITYETNEASISLWNPHGFAKAITSARACGTKTGCLLCWGAGSSNLKHPAAAMRLFYSSCRTRPNMPPPCVIPHVRPFKWYEIHMCAYVCTYTTPFRSAVGSHTCLIHRITCIYRLTFLPSISIFSSNAGNMNRNGSVCKSCVRRFWPNGDVSFVSPNFAVNCRYVSGWFSCGHVNW